MTAFIGRREFITMLGGAATTWPLGARAQQPDRMRRIGVLSNIAEDDPQMKARFGAFRQALEKLGWSEGRNVRIDTRFGAADAEQMEARAKELLALQPDVILANSAAVIRVLQQVNRTIPTVFVAVSDPIGAGLIASLARPGGNFTGLLRRSPANPLQPISRHFERDPISYALETDWPVGAAGFEPLHFRIEIRQSFENPHPCGGDQANVGCPETLRACTSAAPVSESFHARLCRKPATIFARNDWLSRANRASLLRHG
jgi:hypothetical protein